MTAPAPSEETTPRESKLSRLLPGASNDADEKEEIVELLTPDGQSEDVFVVFGYLDGPTRQEYHRVAERNSRRGKPNYDKAVAWLFERKCKRIDGLDKDLDCGGMEPKQFFLKDVNGKTLMNIAINEYLQRQIGSAADSKSTR